MKIAAIPEDLHKQGDLDHRITLLSRSDIAKVALDQKTMLETVETSLRDLGAGRALNPTKIEMESPDHRAMNYAMMGTLGAPQTVGMKLSYKYFGGLGRQMERYYTTLLIFDDTSGEPLAIADCSWITAARTPAVSALLAKVSVLPNARNALIVGSGMQAQYAGPMLAHACPQLEKFSVYGKYSAGLRAAQEFFTHSHPERDLTIVEDLEAAAREADVIIAVAGPASLHSIRTDWVKPGAVCILVGYGLDATLLHDADYRIATSETQMHVTGADFALADGSFPKVDAELPAILAGNGRGRGADQDKIFAYNSGLVVTDIAIGRALYYAAIAQGLGTKISLW